MHLRIFTLPFDEVSEGFPDEVITEFCLNKKVQLIEPHFFEQGGRAFWSVAVQYEMVAKGAEKLRDLDEEQKLLYERLREWRKEKAHEAGIPVYLIATNTHLAQIVRLKLLTLESLKNIKGFGKSRIEKHGRQLLAQVKSFYEEKQKKPQELTHTNDLPL